MEHGKEQRRSSQPARLAGCCARALPLCLGWGHHGEGRVQGIKCKSLAEKRNLGDEGPQGKVMGERGGLGEVAQQQRFGHGPGPALL